MVDYYKVAKCFRSAIIDAKYDGKFNIKDRMHMFPRGCCDDACDLLGYYMKYELKINTLQGRGVYFDDNPYKTTSHAWLVVDDGTIIDITIDQFRDDMDIYVGEEDRFYERLENKSTIDNYDIRIDDRLWKDYQIILNYLQKN